MEFFVLYEICAELDFLRKKWKHGTVQTEFKFCGGELSMDTLYENRYFVTDKMLFEYICKVLYKGLRTSAFIFSVIAGILLLFTLYQSPFVLSNIVKVFLLLILMLSIVIFAPIYALWQMKENSKRINNGQKHESVVKFGDNISISEGTFSLTLEYSQILKIYHLQYSYLLMFGKHNAIMLCPKHFTVGTFEDFETFIEQKVSLIK